MTTHMCICLRRLYKHICLHSKATTCSFHSQEVASSPRREPRSQTAGAMQAECGGMCVVRVSVSLSLPLSLSLSLFLSFSLFIYIYIHIYIYIICVCMYVHVY